MSASPGLAAPPTRGLRSRVVDIQPRRRAWPIRQAGFVLASLCFFAYLSLSWVLIVVRHAFIGDALSRTANTYYIVFSRNPHLAAVGFVWTPVQNFIELPLMAALQPMGLALWSGGIVTALAGALNVVLVKRLIQQLGVTGWPGWVLLLTYAFNPWVVLYAANGMSETLFMSAELAVISAMLEWARTDRPAPLMAGAIACGIGFGFRYESIGLAAAGVLAIMVMWWVKHRAEYERLEGEILAFLSPFVYAAGLWMFANWLMEGSPLYWFNGPGSAAYYGKKAQEQLARNPHAPMAHVYHHLLPAAEYVATRFLWYMPALFLFLFVCLIIYGWRRRFDLMIAFLFPSLALAFNSYALYAGSSEGWFRYYSSALVLGMMAAALVTAYVQRVTIRHSTWPRIPLVLLCLALTSLSMPSTYKAMTTLSVRGDEIGLVDALLGKHTAEARATTWDSDRAMAAYLDRLRLEDGQVVTDTSTAFPIVVFSRRPKQLVISSDFDFLRTFNQLPDFSGFVLVSTRGSTPSELIKQRYPGLLTNTAKWAHLVHRVGPWTLYRLAPPRRPQL